MSWRILNTLDLSGAPEAVAALQAVGQLESLPADRAVVLPALREIDAYLASASVRIDAEFLDNAPKLRVIGSPSTGTDHMDVAEIRRRGITCFDIAREFDLINGFTATSELAFTLLLALNRRLVPAQEQAKKGIWARERFTGFQLRGKTLGILGLGRLGRISARIGQGFGMDVIAHDTADVSAAGVEMVGFEDLLRRCDVLTIHIHLRPETDGLIGHAAFAMMKPSAILLNTSRGRIVDEAALLDALRQKRIAAAGLDVVDGEWLDAEELFNHPLIAYSRDHDNLLIVPHIGGATTESIYGARVFMARKLADHLNKL
ncbi:NAD(P)-dependent oxidoreductase [Ferrovibrio sp.]|uniref:2-hydroxyacid dehydrogenase n=1 Tax=Ferrovibrio sp. TaxID=1917215 RepID=UPI00311DAC7B